jgi:hypothetical protein
MVIATIKFRDYCNTAHYDPVCILSFVMPLNVTVGSPNSLDDINSGFIYGLQQQAPLFWAYRHDALSTQCNHTEQNLTGSRRVTGRSKLLVHIRNIVFFNFSSKLHLPTCQISGEFPRVESTFGAVMQGAHLTNKMLIHFPNYF